MAVTLLPAERYRSTPWRNGLGVSREVAREATPDGDGTRWLLSLTTIARDCPFSDYRGYDRVLTPLKRGVVLAVGGAPPVALDALRPFAFAGDEAVDCRLTDGPAEVINAMVARGWGSQEVALLEGAGEGEGARFAVAAPVVLLHALGGAAVTIAGATSQLAAGDSLRIDAMAGAEAAIAAAPATRLYVAAFRPHR